MRGVEAGRREKGTASFLLLPHPHSVAPTGCHSEPQPDCPAQGGPRPGLLSDWAAPLATLSAHPTSATTSPSTEPGQVDTSVVRTPGAFQTLCRHLLMNSVLFLVKMVLKEPRNFPSSSFPCTRLLPRKNPLVLNLKNRGLEPESLQVG